MPRTQSPSVSVFHFLDAREFLREAYAAEKRGNKDFSHRYISKVMNAGSSSFFKDVLHGRASLSPARVAKFGRLFRLNPKEADYFENLVLYTQAEDEPEKKRLMKKLSEGASRPHALIEAFQMEYLKKWQYAAIRELLTVHDFRDDYEELGKLLEPAISPAEARDAVQLLLKLKLVRKGPQGVLEKADKVISTGSTGNAEDLKPAIRANLDLAQRALDAFPPPVRPFSYLTLSVSGDTFPKIREILRNARKEILDIVSRDEAVDRLYQLNMQLFPLSKTVTRRKS